MEKNIFLHTIYVGVVDVTNVLTDSNSVFWFPNYFLNVYHKTTNAVQINTFNFEVDSTYFHFPYFSNLAVISFHVNTVIVYSVGNIGLNFVYKILNCLKKKVLHDFEVDVSAIVIDNHIGSVPIVLKHVNLNNIVYDYVLYNVVVLDVFVLHFELFLQNQQEDCREKNQVRVNVSFYFGNFVVNRFSRMKDSIIFYHNIFHILLVWLIFQIVLDPINVFVHDFYGVYYRRRVEAKDSSN